MVQKERLKWFSNEILGRELNVDCAEDKQIIQKAVYLAQALKMDFDYKFGWHVRGVYSSPLTVDLYEIKDADSSYTPAEEEKALVSRLSSVKGALCDPNKSFEIISTVMYAKNERGMKREEIIEFIKKVMPWFTGREIKIAINLCDKLKC